MWWKIEEVPHQELENWERALLRCENRAKRDPATRAAGIFVIFVREGATQPEYAPGRDIPKGAYLVGSWTLKKKGWMWYE
jgi:hypothetical protein